MCRKVDDYMMYQAGLVLEGGGMKGIYTAGVLEYLLEQNMEFSHCYGVSAGACHLCSFLSKQRGRMYRISVDYLDDKRYCSIRSLLKTGDLFGADMCYHEIPDKLNKFDYDTYAKYTGKAYAVVTNLATGEAEYLPMKDLRKDIEAVRASASLPLVSRKVKINGQYYLDGGISDSIPIRKAIADGNRKNLVILTKEVGYRRKQTEHLALFQAVYRKYPAVYENMKKRHIRYNETLDFLDRAKMTGKAFVIRPQKQSSIGRIERDRNKLTALYHEGYADARRLYPKLLEYLQSED